MSLIQSTIQDSVQTSVQALVDKMTDQGNRLAKVEHTVGSLAEMGARHNSRLDSMQHDLRELQKSMASPPAGLPSPVGPSAGVGREDVSFDLVVGGWREGSTRAWVERELAQLIASVDMSSRVSQIKTFGKRPGFAKLELVFDAALTVPLRREQQLKILDKLRAANWQPEDGKIWITTDKPIEQRRVSKAVAVLNNFLRTQLGVDHGTLEIASWVAAKAFVGAYRVTGLSEDCAHGTKPPCVAADLRWLVRDPRVGVNVWLDMDALAKGLDLDKGQLVAKWAAHFGRDPA
eukprot:Skav205005  [mRNA]  locus=scaffold3521:176366:177235:- [translate_table: standard]